MLKWKFEHSAPGRDLGGVSSRIVLAFALVTCLEWSFLLHLWR